jgi:hypothetical protein
VEGERTGNAEEQPLTSRSPLARLEELAVANVVAGDASGLKAALAELSRELEGPLADTARLRVLSRALASARIQLAVLEALYASLIAKQSQAVPLIGRALQDTTARVVRLAEAHGSAADRRSRPVLIVRQVEVQGGHADQYGALSR